MAAIKLKPINSNVYDKLKRFTTSDKWIEGYNQRQEELQQFQLNEKNELRPAERDRPILKQKVKKEK